MSCNNSETFKIEESSEFHSDNFNEFGQKEEDFEITPNGVDEELLDLGDETGWGDNASLELIGCGFLDFEEGEGPTKLSFKRLSTASGDKVGDEFCKCGRGIENCFCMTATSDSSPRSSSRQKKRPTILSILSPAQLHEELQQTRFFLTESMQRSALSRWQLDQQVTTGVVLVQQPSGESTLAISRDKITSYIKDVSSMTLGWRAM